MMWRDLGEKSKLNIKNIKIYYLLNNLDQFQYYKVFQNQYYSKIHPPTLIHLIYEA